LRHCIVSVTLGALILINATDRLSYQMQDKPANGDSHDRYRGA
jgi:hypothetical protein